MITPHNSTSYCKISREVDYHGMRLLYMTDFSAEVKKRQVLTTSLEKLSWKMKLIEGKMQYESV